MNKLIALSAVAAVVSLNLHSEIDFELSWLLTAAEVRLILLGRK
jgi:hypothetical protein